LFLSGLLLSLVFFYLGKLLFSGFLQFKGIFVRGKKKKKKSKYRDLAP